MDAENATEGRLVTPNTSATLGMHVVASPASHGALEGGGLSVRSLCGRESVHLQYLPLTRAPYVVRVTCVSCVCVYQLFVRSFDPYDPYDRTIRTISVYGEVESGVFPL